MPEFNEKPRGTANQEESAGVFESDTSDIEESDIELDTSEVVEPDDEPPQPVGFPILASVWMLLYTVFLIATRLIQTQMGDASIDVTEEMRDNAQIAKGKANEAIEEGWGILNFRFDDMVWNIQDSWSVSKFWLLNHKILITQVTWRLPFNVLLRLFWEILHHLYSMLTGV